MYQFTSSLQMPDSARFREDTNYSDSVAELLIEAYTLIRDGHGDISGYLKAEALLNRLRTSRKMSFRQRLRFYYVSALAFAADGNYPSAIEWLDRGILLAERLGDRREMIDLLVLRMSCNRALLAFGEAVADVHDCLQVLDIEHDIHQTDDAHARLYLYSQLATYELYRARHEETQAALTTARSLARVVEDGQFEKATTEWVQAHLYLLQQQPGHAFDHAMNIRGDYVQTASRISQDRFETFLAQAAIRWAEVREPGSYRNHIIQLAGEHLGNAERLANDTMDLNGLGVIHLVQAHYSRLTHTPANRISMIDEVLRMGKALRDVALIAQGYTALGDEFASRGDDEIARMCYRTAINSVQDTDVRMLATPAQRALWRAEEFSVDSDWV